MKPKKIEKINKQIKKIVYEDGTEKEIKYNTTYCFIVEENLNEEKNTVDFELSYNYSNLLAKAFIDQIFTTSIVF
jgi:hypothetical protein